MRPDIDLRGALDTRAALILLPLSVLALAGFAALGGLIQPYAMEDGTSALDLTLAIMSLPLALIIPMLAVPIVAGEWSDSSIQNTFLQRPRRGAVLASKVLAATLVVLAVLAIAFGFAAAATWVGGDLLGEGATFFAEGNSLLGQLLALLETLLFSLAAAMLLQSTVLGLVAAIGVPFVISTASSLAVVFGSDVLVDVLRSVDLMSAAVAVADGSAGAFELLPLLLLVLLPGLLGARRWSVREVG